jgi:hypothetical protein
MKALWRISAGMAVLVLAPAVAAADIEWQLTKKQGRPYLQAMSTEPESDTEFWALCGTGGAIDIGAGAASNVGEGQGEPVSLTLSGGQAQVSLAGQSRNSANFQMTAGTELRARVTRDHAVFKVLAGDQPIKVTGRIEPVTWPVKGRKAKVAAFLAACK